MDREKKLIREILRHNSRKAADQLVRAYYDEMYVFVYRQVGNREEAMDLTQDSFIAVLRSLPSYDEKKGGFRTWLYHIFTYKVIDARRKTKVIPVVFEESELCSTEDFTAQILNRELLHGIEEYIRSLDPKLQEIFRMRVYGECSFPDIARTMDEPEAKIKACYYRLQKRIRKEFQIDG